MIQSDNSGARRGVVAPTPLGRGDSEDAFLLDSNPVGSSNDTIAAISTATGAGAIGIVRLSGPEAISLAARVFEPRRGTPLRPSETYCLVYGHVVDPETREVVDEALLAIMRKPRSYTREDVAELHCHGGIAAQRAVLRLLTRIGARPAEPGEFTRRAFLNGRIDLAQAESVAAIVAARSSGALRASVRQLDGAVSKTVHAARQRLVGFLAQLEAAVDFSDEEIDEIDRKSLGEGLACVESDLQRLLRTGFLGRALERGVSTAIVGKPNVGKSSLLNALAMRERAIVSEVPGTTRDTVEELVEIGGVPIHLVDTAGIRDGGDRVEQLGVARSVQAMEQADLVLAVIDLSASRDESERELILALDPQRSIIVGNKADLVENEQERMHRLREQILGEVGESGLRDDSAGPADGAPGAGEHGEVVRRMCAVSALTGTGVDELRSTILQVVTKGEEFSVEEPVLASERQRLLVTEACERTDAALAAVGQGANDELVSEDIRGAIQALGRITGEDLTADLLDEIFGSFCIGK